MEIATLSDERLWGLRGARTSPALPDAECRAVVPLAALLHTAAVDHGTSDAIIGHGGRISYARLLEISTRVASAIAAAMAPGGVVACILPRSPEAAAALLGCAMSGRLCLAIDDQEKPDRLAALLADALPQMVLADAALPFAHPGHAMTLAAAMAGPGSDLAPAGAWDPDAPSIAHYTSGSSGRPKGIVFSARASQYRALHAGHAWGVTPHDILLTVAHPASSGGFTSMLAALFAGGRFVMADMTAAGARAVLQLAAREGVTCASIPAPILRMLIRLDGAQSGFQHMRALRIGSAALSRTDHVALRRLLPPGCSILHTYSATEAPVIAQWFVMDDDKGLTAEDYVNLPAGEMQASHEYALLTDTGEAAAQGTPGELVLRSHYVALGDWQDGRLVTERMTEVPGRQGWRYLRTGDLAMVDPDGLLRVLGRVDRQVKINAVRVEPAEIEVVLLAEPGVTEAIVVAAIKPAGVALHAFVEAPGWDAVAMSESLRRRLANSLPAALRPARLTVMESLPRLPGGKPDLTSLSRLSIG